MTREEKHSWIKEEELRDLVMEVDDEKVKIAFTAPVGSRREPIDFLKEVLDAYKVCTREAERHRRLSQC